MTTVNTSAIAANLRPGLAAINGMYDQYPTQWKEIYGTPYQSDKAVEIEVQTRFTGLASIVGEGMPLPSDTMGNRYNTSYVHRYVGLQFAITHQALVDNLYKDKFPEMGVSLMNSLAQTKEILGAGILNNGFDPLFPIGDGKPVFSISHPIDAGVQQNTFSVGQDLNETSLWNAIMGMQQFRGEAGLIAMIKPWKLIVPTALQVVANKILGSAYEPATANNAINPLFQDRMVPQGFKVNQFLTSNSAWFLLSDLRGGLKHYVRESVETDVYSDFSNKNLLASAYERYSFGCSDWRAAWGSQGTS